MNVVVAAGRPADRSGLRVVGGIVRVATVKFRDVFVCDVKTLEGCSEKNLEGQMTWASHPPPSEYWMGHGTVCCLLLMVAGLCLLAQVLHLQNKQVIVVPTTVISLPPSAPSTLLSLLCLYCYFCLAGVFLFFLDFLLENTTFDYFG